MRKAGRVMVFGIRVIRLMAAAVVVAVMGCGSMPPPGAVGRSDAPADQRVPEAEPECESPAAPRLQVTGAVSVVEAPASVAPAALTADAGIHVFAEAVDVVLSRPVEVDFDLPGTVAAMDDLHAGSVAAGETVRSFLIHMNTESEGTEVLEGTVTFDRPVAGVIVLSLTLDRSDAALGHALTTYPSGGNPLRGMELSGASLEDLLVVPIGPTEIDLGEVLGIDIEGIEDLGPVEGDTITIESDLRTLRLALRAQESIDQIRVITRGCPAL